MAGMLNNMANLANAKLTADLTSSATTVTLDDASPFANLGTFYATIMPAGEMSRLSNSEIVKCDYASSTTLAITRAQRGTSARAFTSGAILTNGIYVEDLEQAQYVGDGVFDTSYSAGVYTITTNKDMLPAIPSDGMKINVRINTDSSDTPVLDLQGIGAEYSINTGTVINGSTAHNAASLKSGQIYELTFNGTNWETKNIFSGTGTNGLIGASDIADHTITGTYNVGFGGKIALDTIGAANLANNAVIAEKLDKASIINIIYPVGSIYMSTNNVSPETFMGGTWEQIKDTFLLSAGDTYTAGSTGGSSTHKHTVKIKRRIWYAISGIEGTGSNHSFDIVDENGNVGTYSQGTGQFASGDFHRNTGVVTGGIEFTHDGFGQTAQGSTFSSSSLPPYLAVYMWKRTA